MRITVFGARGAVGSRVVTEALSRGHEVTAAVRDPSRLQPPSPAHRPAAPQAPAAARGPAGLQHPSSGHNPTGPRLPVGGRDPSGLRGPAAGLLDGAGVRVRVGDAADPGDVARLSAGQDLVISATRPAPGHEDDLVTTARALLAGVAESGVRLLLVGGAAGLTVPGTGGLTVVETPDFPPSWRPIALACNAQLDVCRAERAADWTYVSPPALIEPGERTGRYRIGADELLVDAAGRSAISMEDFAVALLDEAERPRHRRVRFTVAY
ncbi:NAD(P)-dependent oxidoreductase [Nonomuraea candida]|uniref:NAD(P)-dependent oxidoreductase n=1 Tax=Nonomuraea candida TaxID=359159 RepID=UPI0005BE65E5|nr:NAD(P)H-binding protein [Nonomuraea candida]